MTVVLEGFDELLVCQKSMEEQSSKKLLPLLVNKGEKNKKTYLYDSLLLPFLEITCEERTSCNVCWRDRLLSK